MMAEPTSTTDVWVSGTEAPEVSEWMVAGTDEGAQEMERDETIERSVEQRAPASSMTGWSTTPLTTTSG